jgi:CubicO group peptidase (beta-lactamase class C family)
LRGLAERCAAWQRIANQKAADFAGRNAMRRWFPALAFVAALLAAGLAQGQSLSQGAPEELGFSAERLGRLTQTLRQDVDEGGLPGAVVLIAREGKIAHFESLGAVNPQTKVPMSKDAIFRIYSMTKPVTSVAVMMLVEEGRIWLGDPIAKYLPEFKDVKVGVEKPGAYGKPTLDLVAVRRPITVQDLMRHTSGLTYGIFGDNLVKRAYRENGVRGDFDIDNEEFAKRISALPLMAQPGTLWEYSHSTDVLGRLIEVVSGKKLSEFFKERIFEPLGMKDTSFVVDAASHARIAEPYANDRAVGPVDVHDPRVAYKLEAGGAALSGTAIDYARFLQMLLDGGVFEGKRYLSPKTIGYMASDHLGAASRAGAYLPGEGYGFGLGFAVRERQGGSTVPGSVGDFSWGGAAGTYFWVDPKERMFVVFMIQSPKNRVRYITMLKNMVYAAMTR